MSVNIKQVTIRAIAATECLAAAEDLKKAKNTYDYDLYNATIQLLSNLSMNLAVVSDEEMKYIQEIQKLAGTGTLLKDARSYAIEEIKKVIRRVSNEPSDMGIARSVENLAIDAINANHSTDGTRTKNISSAARGNVKTRSTLDLKEKAGNITGYLARNKAVVLSVIAIIAFIGLLSLFDLAMDWKKKSDNSSLGYSAAWKIETTERPKAYALSPDGKYAAVAYSKNVQIFDAGNGKLLFNSKPEDSSDASYRFNDISCLSFSRDSNYIAAGSGSGTYFFIIEAGSGEIINNASCMVDAEKFDIQSSAYSHIDTIGFSYDNKQLFVDPSQGDPVIFNRLDFSVAGVGQKYTASDSFSICPDYKHVLYEFENEYYLWDTENISADKLLFASPGNFFHVRFSPDMKKIYMIDKKTKTDIVVVDAANGNEISRIHFSMEFSIQDWDKNVYAVDTVSDNIFIFDSCDVVIINSISGKEIGRLKDDVFITYAEVDSHGNIFIGSLAGFMMWKKEVKAGI